MRKNTIVRIISGGMLIVVAFAFNNTHVSANYETAPSTWRSSRSIQWIDQEQQPYATDHILVKKMGREVERIEVPEGGTVENTVLYWQKQEDVEYAEPDGLYRVLGQETSWGWEEVKAGEAATTNSATGSGIIVAVVDTGVDYDHEDLDANNWVNTGEANNTNNVDDDNNGYVDDYYGYDFIGSLYTAVTPDKDPQDEYGHGTHVAGIIAAENNSVGVRGVAPSAQIMPVKVLDSVGYGFDSTIADGIRYAVNRGADIINLSLGSPYGSNTLKSAIDYAETNNVLVVAASGNNASFSGASYPAVYSNVLSVGATNEEGYKAEFSNWGKVDLMAPGVEILSSIPGNLYEQYDGTSMAAPHISGVAALVMQKFSTTDARRARHILEVNAADFGVMTGPDYMSGYGMVDALAATGTQSAEAYLFADTGYIISDGSLDAVLTISLRAANGDAIGGETISWSTNKGTLSAATSTTNSNGQASVTLTADDTSGLATITATPSHYYSTSLQIAILDDVPRVEQLGVSLYSTASDTGDLNEGELIDEIVIEAKPTQENDEWSEEEVTTSTEPSLNIYQPGDQIIIWGYPTAFDREMHDVTMNYEVVDSSGTTLDDLSGTTAETSVGQTLWGFWYLPQTTFQSLPLTIPSDTESGEYTVNITMTDADTSESSHVSTTFWVGEWPEILVIDDDGYCYDTPLEGLDFGYVAYCASAGQKVVDALKEAGYDSLLWNVTQHGIPLAEDLLFFPLVISVETPFTYGDTTILQTYLDAGGNLLVTSEQFAINNTTSSQPSSFLWDYLHAAYGSSITQPDLVTGVSGTEFEGITYNINTYDLEGNGTHSMYLSDELLLNDDGTAEALFAHTQGKTTDHSAGIRVDSGTYRAVLLSFGIETINDAGEGTKADLLNELVSWLLGDKPTIKKVTPKTLENNVDRTITIHGENFLLQGTTKVKLRNHFLSDVSVESSTKLTATVPAGLNPRTYNLTIVRPDGKKATKTKAVKIIKGGPTIDSISPSYASNDRARTITITGNKFTAKSQVFLNSSLLEKVKFEGSTILTATIPKNYAPGHYTVKIVTGNRTTKKKSGLVVRVGFTADLVKGSESNEVLALERRLKKNGYFSATPDISFDNKTEEALVQYQLAQAITASGVLDALTRYTLNTNE